jgi:mRNA-degrading endonuclease RelE of RelBE toxin-antitoxin system
MKWTVNFTRQAEKQTRKLNNRVITVLKFLVEELKSEGSRISKGWPNLSKLKGTGNRDLWHCHLIKGKPTYVCCWEVLDKANKVIEVYYVGSHEKAPY